MDEKTPIAERLNRIVEELKRVIAPIIREHREKKSLSQEALGKALGVSRQAVSMWESATNLPDAARLVVMADYLEAPELAAFVPSWHKTFAETTAPTPDEVVKETPFYTTKLIPGSLDRFVIDRDNVRFADTPPRHVVGRNDASCILAGTPTMMPWRFPSDAVYFFDFKPPRAGNHVLIQLRATPPDGHAVVGREYREWMAHNGPCLLKKLESFDDDGITVRQYSPDRTEVIPMRQVYYITAVIEREDLYGPFLLIMDDGHMIWPMYG